MPPTTQLCFGLLIALVGCILSANSYQSGSQQTGSEGVANPFKNGARPSFRQYSNNGNDYAAQNQQYGYSNGGQYDTQWNQRYPPQYGEANGFQRDPRFNGATAVGTLKVTPLLLGLALIGVCARGLLG